MNVLVTGADGFVGRYLVRRLLADGHTVTAAIRGGTPGPLPWIPADQGARVESIDLELAETVSCEEAAARRPDAVVHLAAVASTREARQDPGAAWAVNAAGTARLAEAFGAARAGGRSDPLMLVVSSGEVYGNGPARPRSETDEVLPQSPYAASKIGAEVAAREVARRTGLRVIIARPFQHIGPEQGPIYVVPSLIRRIREAMRTGADTITTGNLEPVRDISDVRDTVSAYVALMTGGVSGETYNVARGEGIALRDLLGRLTRLLGAQVAPEADPALLRAGDIPHLVGDSTKLREATDWTPAYSIDQTLRDMLDAQAD
ncbi:MAG TPA: GDP-mannose 4,6-dehydratase [Gemmatimonadales bacterium]|nr:GDP-mannose 4,6-dehydratase [Gemmatimonadales bacterium]